MTRGKITADYADLNGWFNANGMPSEVDKVQFFKLYQLYPRNPRFSMSKGLRIFVLADTHNKLPQKILDLAGNADEIWHLGDVCEPTITDDLSAVGPRLTVVRGNCDWNSEWPLVIDLTRDGLKFRLQHIPSDVPPDDVDVVLHGHTHVPRNEKRYGVLFLNPGCVTRPNQGSPASAAWLEIASGKIKWRLVEL